MTLSSRIFSLLLLTTVLALPTGSASARTLLGISYSENQSTASAKEAPIASQMEEAFGNLVTIHNYQDHKTLINMLTRFNKLDAALITRQTYNKHNSASLITLAEIEVSGATEKASLVLATHSYMSKAEHEQLMEGYQELLLSTAGLELLEKYAKQHTVINQQVATTVLQNVTGKEQDVVAVDKEPPTQVSTSPATHPKEDQAAVSARIIDQPTTAMASTVQAEPVVDKVSTSPKEKPAPEKGAHKYWGAHADIKGKLGNDKSLGELELFVPVTQGPDSMFFLDLRFQLDDNNSEEGNFGLGYRKLIDNKWILGSYAFYDHRKSATNNDFHQVTIGTEALTEEYDARFNIYLAEDKEYLTAQKSLNQVIYSGIHLVHQTGGKTVEAYEKAMSGFDAEVGWLLPWFKKQEIRGYAGGYFFSRSGLEDISGPRGRLEVRFNDLWGWAGSLFEIGGEVRHDSVRDTDYFVSARGRIPFGAVQKTVKSSLSGLNKRMLERVQRDPDIVIARQNKEISKPVINKILTSGGNPITLTHIDSQGANGDGSYQAPYNTLEPAVPPTSDIVLLYAGSDFSGESFSLAAGQRLLGETVGHEVSTDQFGPISLPRVTSRTAMPIIRNVTGTAVNLASDSEVSGISITDVTTALYGSNVGGFDLNRNRIANSDEGIVIEGLMPGASTTQITENSFKDILIDGINIDSSASGTVSANITGNQMQNIGTLFGSGIVLFNEGQDMRVNIADNNISSSDEGILGINSASGTVSATVTNNQVRSSDWDGIAFINDGDTVNLSLQNNHADGDIDNTIEDFFDYYIENNAGTFNLGATANHPDIGSTVTGADIAVIADEGNTRADQVTDPVSEASGPISIVDKGTIPAPSQ